MIIQQSQLLGLESIRFPTIIHLAPTNILDRTLEAIHFDVSKSTKQVHSVINQNFISFVDVNSTINILCDTSYSTDVVSSCGPITWLDGNTYATNNNSATYTMVGGNVAGCDSVITLNLSIEGAFDLTIEEQPNQQLQAQATGVSYQWLDCGNGNAEIPGETSQLFTPSELGFYAVELSNGTCIDTTMCVQGVIISNGVDIEKVEFTVFPNPGQGEFTISSDFPMDHIRVYNALGSLVYEEIQPTNSLNIVRFQGEYGLYLIQVSTNNRIFNKIYIKGK